MSHTEEKPSLKARHRHELAELLGIFIYLAVFFLVFAWYRNLLLAKVHLPLESYWTPLIEALIMAKVIMILQIVGVGRKLEDGPLVVPTLAKTFLFGIGVFIFAALEAGVRGLIHHEGFGGGIRAVLGEGSDELLSRALVKCCALVPYFAFSEAGRVLGEGRLRGMFFKRGPSARGARP